MAKAKQTAEFVKWMRPIWDVLKQLGGYGVTLRPMVQYHQLNDF